MADTREALVLSSAEIEAEEARRSELVKRQINDIKAEAVSVRNEAQLAMEREAVERAKANPTVDPKLSITDEHMEEGKEAVERHKRNMQGVHDPRDLAPLLRAK